MLLACFWICIVQKKATCLCFCPVFNTVLLELMTEWWAVFSPRLLSLINPGTWPDNIPWIIWTLLNRTPLFFCSCFEPQPCCEGLFLSFWDICRHWEKIPLSPVCRYQAVMGHQGATVLILLYPFSFSPCCCWTSLKMNSVILQRSALFFSCQ